MCPATRCRHYPQAIHPAIRTYPDTGRNSIFVNRTFTTRINELAPAESDAVPRMLLLAERAQGSEGHHQG